MAQDLGLSRVALWKRIETLKAWGYGIQASRRGYLLVQDDGLAPWDFNAPGPVHLYDTIPSTMDKAHELAQAGSPSGTMVLALRQSAGRDRSGAPWISPSGGLYFSLVLRTDLPAVYAGTIVLEAAKISLGYIGSSDLVFDWPGALRAKSARLGGLLLEFSGAMGRPDHYVLGLGINVIPLKESLETLGGVAAKDPVSSGSKFVSLVEMNGEPVHRARLAVAIAETLSEWVRNPVLDPERWAGLVPQGQRTAILWNGEVVEVLPDSFTSRGELLCAGGRLLSIGECVKLKKYGRCI